MAISWEETAEEELTTSDNNTWFERTFGKKIDAIYAELFNDIRCLNDGYLPSTADLNALKAAVGQEWAFCEAEATFQRILSHLVFKKLPMSTNNNPLPHNLTGHAADKRMSFGFGYGNSNNRRYRIIGELQVPLEEGWSPHQYDDRPDYWKEGLFQLSLYIARCLEITTFSRIGTPVSISCTSWANDLKVRVTHRTLH